MDENVKGKTTSRVKERRQPYNQDGIPKKSTKHQGLLKNDLAQIAPSPSFDGNSPVKKLLSEANKIVKIGMENEYALLEKDSTLQNSTETIDNLRKNMILLQMEYEKLDQNFQREISYRSELVKRMEATREFVESVVQCSNVLAASVKQLEDDKFRISEYYEIIYQNQKEVESKRIENEKFITQQDEILKAKMDEITKFQCKIVSHNSETISQLNKKLTLANDKLKKSTDENENLQQKIQGFQESSTKLQTFLQQQEKLNCLHQETIGHFKECLKKSKVQRLNYEKSLRNKKKKLSVAVNKNKKLKKVLTKTELLYRESVSTNEILESKNMEWRSNFGKHMEEDAKERQNWETEKRELINQLRDKQRVTEELKAENKNLNSKILELTSNEEAKQKELEQTQNDLSKMLNENLKLKEDVNKTIEENNDKAKIISELEIKTSTISVGLSSQMEFYKNEYEKLQDVVKNLESQLSDVQKTLAYEKAQKKEISDFNSRLDEVLKESDRKITDLEKLLQDKVSCIEKLEAEQETTALNMKTSLEKLRNELQLETSRNKELNTSNENMKESYMDVCKQLDDAKNKISHFEEKLADLNSLNETLNRNQTELEKNVEDLKKERQSQKKLFGALEEKHKNAEKELLKMQKISEENSSLKSTTAELKKLVEATELRLEMYKIAVKKLENEKIIVKNNHSEEVSKLKLDLARLEEGVKNDQPRLGTPQKSIENTQGKREPETPVIRKREKPTEPPRKLNAKENEPEMQDVEKWQQQSASPLQTGKKFLSTPRKSFFSTPQPSFRNSTPIQKKRDPYEFDSDSSVERFDPDKVLRVFNRQKKETANKKSKTHK